MFPACRLLGAAYAATAYIAGTTIIRLGARSPAVDRLLGRAPSACFVTACNPRGLRRGRARNLRAMARLRASLRQAGLRFVAGEGRGDDGTWPAEPSLLVLGLRRAQAAALGRRWQQNAVVFVRRNRPARLLPLR
jgi:uncharacterized membrane protein